MRCYRCDRELSGVEPVYRVRARLTKWASNSSPGSVCAKCEAEKFTHKWLANDGTEHLQRNPRWLLAAIIATLVADSALAEIAIRSPSPSAVVGATRTLPEGATGCPELERLLAMATLLKGGNPHGAIQLFQDGRCIQIQPGTSVTVTELSPLGECLRPEGAQACLWTLNGSFGK